MIFGPPWRAFWGGAEHAEELGAEGPLSKLMVAKD
jgi:hypothetical protein